MNDIRSIHQSFFILCILFMFANFTRNVTSRRQVLVGTNRHGVGGDSPAPGPIPPPGLQIHTAGK